MKRTFAELEEAFLANTDVAAVSKKSYGWALNQFKKWVVYEGRNIERLERADVLAYKASLEGSGKSEATMDFYLLAVRQFYRFVEDNGFGENIAAGVRYRRRHRGHYKEHLSDEEATALLESVSTASLIGLRDYAIIYLMLCTGLRCVEVSRLTVGDLHVGGECPYLLIQRKGETRSTTRFGITPQIVRPIEEYLHARGCGDEEEPLFVTCGSLGARWMSPRMVSRVVLRRMRAAGVYSKTKTAHSLRHTAAVRAIKMKIPIREVQVMLGHKNVHTTEIYLASVNDEMRLMNPAVRAISFDDVRGKSV